MKVKKYRLKYNRKDIAFVQREIKKALKLGYLTDGGPNVAIFEEKWSNFNNSKHSIAVSNCTAGLECIFRSINIEGKSVVVPAYTFIASIMSIYNARGTPILADIDKRTLSLSLKSIKRAVREDTKAVVIVHVGGVVSDEIEEIRNFCDEKGIFLIEDAACAHGSSHKGKKSGNFGHAACFSFHHSKVLTSGEGGVITTDDDKLADKIRKNRAIGLDRSINNWESFEIGSNSKMSEITAILAILHTDNAEKIIQERQKIARFYNENIKFNDRFMKFELPNNTESSYYKYFIRVDDPKTIEEFKEFSESKGVYLPPRTYSYTCEEQAVCKKMKCEYADDLEESKFMKNHHFCLPMYNGLKKKELKYIVEVVNKYLANNEN